MSAKLLKSFASGSCKVVNVTHSEVIVYWKTDRNQMAHYVIRPGMVVDLLVQGATIPQLRKSPNLKNLFSRGFLKVAT